MGMEDDTREFLIRIVHTISLTLIWMIANMMIGIYYGLGFFENSPGWQNILYYVLSLSSLIWLLLNLRRRWRL
jgi:hypothetical protein